MRVLVGDIGGTKTWLGLAEVASASVSIVESRRYPSGDFDSLETILHRYFSESALTAADCPVAAFAIAGPIEHRRCKTTNLPWVVDADSIESSVGFQRVRLMNDLEAVAWGVPALAPDDLAVLHPGGDAENPDAISGGNACVVAAGTGLGEAGLFWDGKGYRPFPTEGGHSDFAPTDDREVALLRFLQERYGRVSWERVVSGMGIGAIYGFMLRWRRSVTPDWLAQEIARGDLPGAVARAAAGGLCAVCIDTMALFFRLYGREAGNMALKHLALGGVYLGGGIAPKNLDALRKSQFLEGFFAKGRMEPLMRRMPIQVILRADIALLGAGRAMLAELA